MQTWMKVSIALLVLTVRLWSKLGGLREALRGGDTPDISIMSWIVTIAILVGFFYYLYP